MGIPLANHIAHEEISHILKSFAPFGVKLGLESTHTLLLHLGNPHIQLPIVHVAGTNGKGSVCAYLSSILTQAGYRVGRYTSPHLIDWPERICINNHPIQASSLLQTLQTIQSVIHREELDATQFEVITAAAWHYFTAQKVDIAIIEVGLGGRLDATNVCDRPLASIITSVGRDHWQQLGNTIGDIAREKAGILKPHCPAIIGAVPPEAQAVIAQRARQLQCPTHWVLPAIPLADNTFQYCLPSDIPPTPKAKSSVAEPSSFLELERDSETSQFHSQSHSLTYSLGLKGDHQRNNSAVAIATIQTLQTQGWRILPEDICKGLSQTQWPGRLQWITWNGQAILVDGAHNTAAAIALRQYVNTLPQPIHWIIGMLETKDHSGVLQALLRSGDRVSLVPIPESNTLSPQDLARMAQDSCSTLTACHIYNDVVDGLNQATLQYLDNHDSDLIEHSNAETKRISAQKPRKSGTLVMCGSLYLIGYVLKILADQASMEE